MRTEAFSRGTNAYLGPQCGKYTDVKLPVKPPISRRGHASPHNTSKTLLGEQTSIRCHRKPLPKSRWEANHPNGATRQPAVGDLSVPKRLWIRAAVASWVIAWWPRTHTEVMAMLAAGESCWALMSAKQRQHLGSRAAQWLGGGGWHRMDVCSPSSDLLVL